MKIEDKVYFSNLDSIRFFAALMVFIAHGISPSYLLLNIKDKFFEKILKTFSSGGVGVSIFFVLSGFLITYLLMVEKFEFGRIDIKSFYVRRILRIWPLYYTLLIFTFFIYPFLKSLLGVQTELGSNIYMHLFFLSNFDVLNILQHCYGSDAMSQNVTWSVSVEEQFYLFWPIVIAFIPNRFLLTSILLIAVASLVFRIVNHDQEFVLYYHTFSVFMDMAIGGLFAFLSFTNQRFKDFLSNFTSLKHSLLLGACFCWLFIKHNYLDIYYGDVFTKLFSAILFALVVASQCFANPNTYFNLGKIRFANYWGKYTYGIYMWHPVALLFIDILKRQFSLSRDSFFISFTSGISGLVLTFIISYLSYELMESKFLKLKKKFTLVISGA